MKSNKKHNVSDLAIFGGDSLFTRPVSTSNLVRPDFETFMDYSKQFIERSHYTNNGILVRTLESRLAEFHGSKYCISFCNGFWAIVLAISSLARQGKSEVIMPSLTYRRMADIAAWAGLKPRFCEVDENTLAVSAETVKSCINSNTALILAVHPIVNCCDVSGIVQLAADEDIPLLFDSVESVYEEIKQGKIGGFGDAECFSMHASKLINGFEGGYVTTNNSQLAHKLSTLRTFGFEGQDNCVMPNGLNAKLNEIHAAMALSNLDILDEQVKRNEKRYRQYLEGLATLPGIRLLKFDEKYRTSFKNIVVEVLDDWPLDRDELVDVLNSENILARAYYSPPLHQKEMRYPYVEVNLSVTDRLATRYMLLPCGDHVGEKDIGKVLDILDFIYDKGSDISTKLGKHPGH